jgi:hypothetical protein
VFIIYKFYILPAQFILVFCSELKKNAEVRAYFRTYQLMVGLQPIPRNYRTLIKNLYINQCSVISIDGRAITHVVMLRRVTEEARVRFEVSPSRNYGGKCWH